MTSNQLSWGKLTASYYGRVVFFHPISMGVLLMCIALPAALGSWWRSY